MERLEKKNREWSRLREGKKDKRLRNEREKIEKILDLKSTKTKKIT